MNIISIKQPWAGLFFAPPIREVNERELGARRNGNVKIGRKCIEVRTWQVFPRGMVRIGERLAIHASKTIDINAQELFTTESQRARRNLDLGGIIGTCVLRGYKTYTALNQFNADAQFHLIPEMDSTWWREILYEGKQVFGLVLTDPEILPFRPCPGQLGFFEVNL